jgi:hypothetical protein
MPTLVKNQFKVSFDLLYFIRCWLDSVEIRNPNTARLLCKLIPAQCPFARTIKLSERTLLRIPPLCKLNPLYEQLVNLRFKSLCYLESQCIEA